jgi:hypothetical protein
MAKGVIVFTSQHGSTRRSVLAWPIFLPFKLYNIGIEFIGFEGNSIIRSIREQTEQLSYNAKFTN